ncbi:MAG: ethylbenzene dehydrogenase-related protein [bacterium]
MKRLIFVFAILSMGLIWGCGGDDGGGTTPVVVPPRIEVTTNTTGLDLVDPLDSDWGTIDSVTVDVTQGIPPAKINPSLAASVTDEVKVKAAIRNDSLFMWFQWVDATNDIWPDNWNITSANPLMFERSLFDHEDQMFALFYNTVDQDWDVWNWRVITTGTENFAEGMSWNSPDLTVDANGTASTMKVAFDNKTGGFQQPEFVHQDTCEFTDPILLLTDAISRNTWIFRTVDDSVHWYQTTGWQVDQKIQGLYIDGSASDKTEAQRGSRWDIGAYSAYSNNTYSLVMVRKLNTGYTDDFDLSALDSVKVQVGILNNQESFTTGSSNRGFSEYFWLIF